MHLLVINQETANRVYTFFKLYMQIDRYNVVQTMTYPSKCIAHTQNVLVHKRINNGRLMYMEAISLTMVRDALMKCK